MYVRDPRHLHHAIPFPTFQLDRAHYTFVLRERNVMIHMIRDDVVG
jgi:hypothetical protein